MQNDRMVWRLSIGAATLKGGVAVTSKTRSKPVARSDPET